MMDGVGYPPVDIEDIPPAYVTVDIDINNAGNRYKAMILAGVAAGRVSSSGDTSLSASGNHDTVAPAAAYWLFDKLGEE